MQEIVYRDSFWAEDPSPERTPQLEGDTRADVVVIGAGMVGLSCAYYLRKEGLDVALLERDHVGYATSGRNFGILTPTLGPWLGDWGDFYGSELWQMYHAWLQSSVDEAERVVAEEGIECEFKRRPMWFAVLEEEQVDEVKRNVERHVNMGDPARFVNAEDMEDLVSFKTYGGMALDGGAAIHPWRMVRGYRELVLREGVRLYEGTPAESIAEGPRVVVRTPRGRVTADKAVLAMNAFSGQFGSMYKYILPRYGYALATEPLDGARAAAVGRADEELVMDFHSEGGGGGFYHRFRSDRRLLCGGSGAFFGGVQALGSKAMAPPQGHQDAIASLHAEMVRRFPPLADVRVEVAWGGATARTSTFLPIFAEDPEQQNVIVALIGNGRGMIGAGCGRLVTGLVLGKDKLDEPARAFLDLCAGPQDSDPRIMEAALKARIETAEMYR